MEVALTVASPLRPLLRAGARGHVASSHRRAANLALGGALVALTAPELGAAPWAIQVSVPPTGFAAWLQPGAAVVCDGERLLCGGWALGLRGAATWEPLPRRPQAVPGPGALLAWLARALPGGAAAAPPWTEAMAPRLRRLNAALTAADPACSDAAQALTGLGPGLTPSGDDILAGLTGTLALAAHWQVLPAALAPVVTALASLPVAGRTTLLAAALRQGAARGWLPEYAGALAAALLAGDAEGAALALPRLLALGATSGADLADGVAMAAAVLVHHGAPAVCGS